MKDELQTAPECTGNPADCTRIAQAEQAPQPRRGLVRSVPPDLETLRGLIAYDPATGIFTNKVKRGYRQAGMRACHVSPNGYAYVNMLNRQYQAHALAWYYVYGRWPVHQIDHINGEKIDNRIDNLRDVLPVVNNQNMRRASRNNKTGLLGVSLCFGTTYRAQIGINGTVKTLGYFKSPEAASECYLAAKRKLHEGCTI